MPMPPVHKPKPKPDEICLVCKSPKDSKPGTVFQGRGSNGMIVKFWLCNEDATKLGKA
jgi:hypothetical protein